MTQIVAVDLGGTHARFALADVGEGRVTSLGRELVLATSDYASFQSAWAAFAENANQALPTSAAIAVAGAVEGEVIRLTNNPWTLQPASFAPDLGLHTHLLLNDFAAVAHAVAHAGAEHFNDVCGPRVPLPEMGTICVVGPGTGLGVAQLHRTGQGYRVIPTEGGHIGFAPADDYEDAVTKRTRSSFGRASAERLISGSGLRHFYEALGAIESGSNSELSDVELWSLALASRDSLASDALDRFCMAFGSVAGDLALVQGASAVVIAGGLGYRLREHLRRPAFANRFQAKGRFEKMMRSMPVKLIVHPQPGLFGAAAAFAMRNRSTA